MTDRVPRDSWKTIVSYSPLVSVDLIVESESGIVVGKRKNKPAKGKWFTPGGIVRKEERLEDAVHRVAKTELGQSVNIKTQLGVYEHHYPNSEFSDVSKHYIAIGYVVTVDEGEIIPDSQHSELKIVSPHYDKEKSDLHKYMQRYLTDYIEWKDDL